MAYACWNSFCSNKTTVISEWHVFTVLVSHHPAGMVTFDADAGIVLLVLAAAIRGVIFSVHGGR